MKKHGSQSLQNLFRTQQLWCGRHTAPATQGLDTGYPALNNALHANGWPKAGLIELLCQQFGIGELQLTLPAIKATQQSNRYALFSNTPYTPCIPALNQHHINSSKLLLLKPLSKAPLLWALEQSLRSGACGAIISWLHKQALRVSELRKLQLAAQQGNCLLFLFRHPQFAQQASPAKLRIRLAAKPQQLLLNIIKQPGGWAGQTLSIAQTQHAHSYISATQLPSITSSSTYKATRPIPRSIPPTPLTRLNA